MVRALAPTLPVLLVLGSLFLAMLQWGQTAAQDDGPPGCELVFAATTRGGGVAPSGGGCNLVGGGGTRVERIIDGDTIVIAGGQRVRYIGIDTPELGEGPEPLAQEAAAYNRRLLQGHRLRLGRDVSETDRYGRLLRYVYADGILVNAELVREGLAAVVRFPPDTRYASCFEALEQEAREEGRGLWAP